MREKHSGIVMVVIVGLIIALIIVSLNTKPEINVGSETGITKDTLSVMGNSELTVAPDKAELYVSVLTEGETAKEVQDKNKVTSNKVIQTLKKQGIKDEDIETNYYNLRKKTEWDPVSRENIDKGYILTHTLKVTTTSIDKAGNLVDIAVDAGANGVDSISFGLTKETEKEVRDESLKQAGENAKDKAESITKALGLRLGNIINVQEANFYFIPYEYAPRAAGLDVAEEKAVTQIQPQKVEVRSSINVVFSIS